MRRMRSSWIWNRWFCCLKRNCGPALGWVFNIMADFHLSMSGIACSRIFFQEWRLETSEWRLWGSWRRLNRNACHGIRARTEADSQRSSICPEHSGLSISSLCSTIALSLGLDHTTLSHALEIRHKCTSYMLVTLRQSIHPQTFNAIFQPPVYLVKWCSLTLRIVKVARIQKFQDFASKDETVWITNKSCQQMLNIPWSWRSSSFRTGIWPNGCRTRD